MTRLAGRWSLSVGLASMIAGGLAIAWPEPAAARKKKLSLAQIAALEWKLEQASNALAQKADVKARLAALGELASVDDPRVVPPLARAVREDPDAKVRRRAVELLGKIKTPEAKGILQLTVEGDPDKGVRTAAKEALKKYPRRMKPARLPLHERAYKPPKKVTSKAVYAALELPSADARLWAVDQFAAKRIKGRERTMKLHLRKDPSARVRVRCAEVLAKVGGKRSLPSLVKATGDGEPAVRFAVARALSSYDDAGAVKVLQTMAARDPSRDVRAEAADLLEPSTEAGRRLLRQRITKLSSANPGQRITALEQLSKFTQWRAMVPMACTLLRDENTRVRQAAAAALSDMHDTSVLTAMRVAAVIEPDKAQRNRVRALLKTLRRRVDQLIKQLSDDDPAKRVHAARALGQAAYPPGLGPLIKALSDKNARVRRAVALALTNFEGKKARAALERASSDADKQVRKIVAQYIKRRNWFKRWRKFYKDVNRLVTKTTDKNPAWRIRAAVALGVAGAERTTYNLIQLLKKDKDEAVRLAAAWALVLMGNKGSEKALHRAAKDDPSERVRLAARKYLVIGKVSPDDLKQQIMSKDKQVRADAAEALSLRATRDVQYHLIRAAMCDPVAHVRSAAMRGLARIATPLARTVLDTATARETDKQVKQTALVMYILAGGR